MIASVDIETKLQLPFLDLLLFTIKDLYCIVEITAFVIVQECSFL